MGNILEFLRGVTTDPEAQRVFRADPEGFVTRAGFADLTGEDVVEGVNVVRRTLPPELADALVDFEDERRIPPVRPAHGEREVDAALRLLAHAVDLASGELAPQPVEAPAPPTPFWEAAEAATGSPAEPEAVQAEPEAPPAAHHDEPLAAEADLALTDPEPAAHPEVTPPPHPPSPAHQEPLAAETDAALAVAPPAAPVPTSGVPDRLGEAIRAAADEVATTLDAYARSVRERLAGEADHLLEQARAEAAELRAEAASLRAEAEADRDAARQVLHDAQQEAEQIRAAAQQGHEELAARRAELKEAERELRERIAGLDSVFRTVLRDE